MRLGHAQIRFKHDQPMNQLVGMNILDLVPELSVSNKWARYDSLGVVYDKGPLQIQGMINQIRYETSAYENTRAAYTIAAYRLGQITPLCWLFAGEIKSVRANNSATAVVRRTNSLAHRSNA